ncbi:MAG TPA: glycosyltransferase family 39 protein [Acidimicrobiales bacterium]|nr:glycosyltransferase family 39 protein [Acidimicrobiales bacterium]
MSEPETDERPEGARDSRQWEWLIVPVAAYFASRLVTLAAAYAVRFVVPGFGVVSVMTRKWDATWYLSVAEHGYPADLPTGVGNAGQSAHGFFPLFPLLTRLVAELPGVSLPVAAVLVNTLAGLLATILLWRLVTAVFDRVVADRSVFLFCFFVGSYAFTFAYTEGVFLACAAGCLLLLHHQRWWWAAVVGGIGSASRPTGYVFAVTCAVAVFLHWRETRDWKPLASPLLAASGLVAFHVYLHLRTGDAFAWQRVQERGWGQRTDWGISTARRVGNYLLHPNHDLNLLVPVLSVLVILPLAWLLLRARPPVPWVVFAAFTLAPGLVAVSVALTPRHLFAAFPLLVGAAVALSDENLYRLTLAVSAGVLAVLMFVTGGTVSLTP